MPAPSPYPRPGTPPDWSNYFKDAPPSELRGGSGSTVLVVAVLNACLVTGIQFVRNGPNGALEAIRVAIVVFGLVALLAVLRWRLLLIVGSALAASSLIIFVWAFRRTLGSDSFVDALLHRVAMLALPVLPLGASVWLLYGARLMRQGSAVRVLPPAASPVLYLRPFSDDSRITLAPSDANEEKYAQVLNETQEQQIAEAFDRIGPVVAIGHPGETYPPWGARRLYVKEGADWQAAVRALIPHCALLILVAGKSAGVAWEEECARESETPLLVLRRSESAGWNTSTSERMCIEATGNLQTGDMHALAITAADAIGIEMGRRFRRATFWMEVVVATLLAGIVEVAVAVSYWEQW